MKIYANVAIIFYVLITNNSLVNGKKMRKDGIYLFIAYIIWGLLPIFWKQLSSVSPIYILSSRIAWSFVFCFLIIVLKRNLPKLKNALFNKKEMALLAISGIAVSINWGIFIYCVDVNKILEASLSNYLNPIFSILVGFFIFKERLNFIQFLAFIFAFTGVIISIIFYGHIPYLAFAMTFFFTIYSIVKKVTTTNTSTSNFIETIFLTPLACFYIVYAEKTNQGALNILSSWKLLLLPLTGVATAVPLLLFSKGIQGKETIFCF